MVGRMDKAELFDAGKKGRGLRATRDLQAGEVVFAEPSFSAVAYDRFFRQVCHSCFRQQANLHRCAQCQFAHYCDRTCQTASWDEHRDECAAIRRTGTAPSDTVRLAARVLWRIHKHTGVVTDTQLTPVETLQDHVGDLPEDKAQELDKDVLDLQKYWSNGSKSFSHQDILHVFGIIKCNGFALSDQRGLQAVGVGLFPNLALVNHDCWPNCTVSFNHGNQTATSTALHSRRRIELRALTKVAEGEELTVSYVDFLNLAADRQKELEERYHFVCSCQHCKGREKDDLMEATQDVEGKKPSAEQVKELMDLSQQCLERIQNVRDLGEYHEVAKLCQERLEEQEKVLAETHLSRLRLLAAACDVLSYLHKFPEAAACAQKMVAGLTKLYHSNNSQLGLAIMRAGVVHWHAGDIEVGHSLICKAFSILMVTHGPNHAITRDLEVMRRQTETELKMLKKDVQVPQPLRE